MMINFTERPKFSDNFSNWWRNLLAFFVVVLAIVTGLLYYRLDSDRQFYLAQFTSEKNVEGIKETNNLELEIGGDINVEKNLFLHFQK